MADIQAAPVNGDDLLARIKPKLRRIRHQVCMRPDLLDDWQDAADALEQARDASLPDRLSSDDTSVLRGYAEKVKAIEDEMDAVSPWFEFEALSIPEYQALVSEHPPREGDQMDLYAGHNRDAVLDALVRQCLIDPVFSDEGWAKFLETCAPSEWSALRVAVTEANGGTVKPPKSRLASRLLAAPANDSE